MKKVFSFLLSFAIISGGAFAFADDNSKRAWRIPVGVYAGSTGFGLKAGFEWRWIGVYGTAASTFNLPIKLGTAIEADGVSFGNLNLGISSQDYGIDLRARPFQGAFHVDIGYHYLDLKVSASSKISVDLREFASAKNVENLGIISGDIGLKLSAFKGWKPYFGFGWDWNLIAQLHLSLDIGVMYVGNYALKANLDLSKIRDDARKNVDVIITDAINEIREKAEKQYGEQAKNYHYDFTGADINDYLGDIIGNAKLREWKEANGIENDKALSQEQLESVSKFVADSLIEKAESDANANIAESLNDINKLLNKVRVYPMIKIGLTYKF